MRDTFLTFNLNHLLHSLNEAGQLLVFGALVRVFTPGQAARLVCGGDAQTAEKLLDELLYTERWIGRLGDIKLPRNCGGGIVSVYYLTTRGADALKTIALEIHKHARPGQPCGKLRERIPHELLVAEAFIWLHQRYLIKDFWPETELKRQMGKARAKAAGKRRISLSNEATGDFKILVNEGERDIWVECEIAVNYEFDEIAVKPNNMVWFTANGRQADLIETIKGVRPILLGDVTSPNNSRGADATDGCRSTRKKQHRLRRTFSERVLVALDRLERAGTAEAVSMLLRVNRGNVARCLSQLAADGILARDAAHLRPGEDRGRPATLYFRPQVQLSSIHVKVRYLIVSRAITLIAGSDYRLHQYDLAKGHLEFRHRKSAKEPALFFVIDDQSQPADTTFTRLQNTEAYARARGALVAAFVAAPTRIARLKVLCKHHSPNSKVIDVWSFGRTTESG